MTDPSRVPLPVSPTSSAVSSNPFSPLFSPTTPASTPNHAISPLTHFTPLTSNHAHRQSIGPSDSVSAAPSRRSSSHTSYGVGGGYLRSASPGGQGPFRPRLDRHATIRKDTGQSQQPDDPFYEGTTIEVNQPVGSLSISPSNRDVCLASRKGLYIIDVANLHNAPRFVPQGGTWQIAE